MGVAYFIVLDRAEPGFDTFVDGKSIIRDAQALSKLAKSLGLRAPEDYFAMTKEDAEIFDVNTDFVIKPDQWFEASEGVMWVAKLRDAIRSEPTSVKHADAVLNDLGEFEHVFTQARAIGAKWHFSIDI